MPRLHTLIALVTTLAPVIAAAGPCLDIGVVRYGGGWTQTSDIITALVDTGMFESVETSSFESQLSVFYERDAALVFMGGIPGGYPDETLGGIQLRHGVAYQRFVDGGGGLVFTQGGIGEDIGPLGPFRDDYMPLSSPWGDCAMGETTSDGPVSMEEPLFWNVRNLYTHERTQRACVGWSVPQGATVHAWWADGQPLVTSKNGVFAVNIYGHSDQITMSSGSTRSSGYPSLSRVPQLFANALYLSAGFDPRTACNGDYDDNGLRDEEEADLGTDFQRADTDADDVSDGFDNCPLQSNPDQQDTDNDGVGDTCEPDDTEPDTEVDTDAAPDTDGSCSVVGRNCAPGLGLLLAA